MICLRYEFLYKFMEIYTKVKDKEIAYSETRKLFSPFIDNVLTHTTGAAIDMTLFRINKGGTRELLDMGKFDVIFGPNEQQETFLLIRQKNKGSIDTYVTRSCNKS